MLALRVQRLCLQQHASHVVVLRGIADEEIEFRHETFEHFARLGGFAPLNRSQESRLALLFLASVLGFDQSIREDDQPVAGR